MTTQPCCPQCGKELPSDAPVGLCPECLLKQGFESRVEGDSASRSPTVIGAGFVPPEPEELAEHFPQLEILELIGKGGMGAVYKVRQPALDRIVALKILPPEVGNDPAFAERFTREARALAKLSHQNIVGVYDFGQTTSRSARVSDPAGTEDRRSPDSGETSGQAGGSVGDRPQHEDGGLYYFLMEYVDGTNLRELIRQRNVQPDEALAIVPQICEALQFAHEEGVVHRDIKPENILVDKKGRVKIADFGLAKLLLAEPVSVTLTQAGQVMGTWYYMAPEQIERPLEVDHRADIYSLGVVFYEMLTGEVPAGRFDPPSRKAQIDVRLDEVVLRALEREPARRYQHASDVKTQVESICGMPREAAQRIFGSEFRSKATLFGVPLVHIAFGFDPHTGRSRTAKGIIAIGDKAIGVFAFGGLALGGVAVGGVACGLFALGGVVLGLLATGGLATGGLTFGGLSVGAIAVGGGAIGIYALGGWAWGQYVLGPGVRDPEALQLFEQLPWARSWEAWLAGFGIGMPVFGLLMFVFIWVVLKRQQATVAPSPPPPDAGVDFDPDAVRRAVRAPADGIIVTAIVSFVPAVLIFLGDVMDLVPAGPLERLHNAGISTFVISMFVGIPSILAVPVGLLMLQGALRMQGLTSYRWARIGAILAMLPLTPAWLLGLPMGLWALAVLNRPQVRAGFGRVRESNLGAGTGSRERFAPGSDHALAGRPTSTPTVDYRDELPSPVSKARPVAQPPATTVTDRDMPESVRRQLRGPAIGLLTTSIAECVILIVGIIFIISIIVSALVYQYPPPGPSPPPSIESQS